MQNKRKMTNNNAKYKRKMTTNIHVSAFRPLQCINKKKKKYILKLYIHITHSHKSTFTHSINP